MYRELGFLYRAALVASLLFGIYACLFADFLVAKWRLSQQTPKFITAPKGALCAIAGVLQYAQSCVWTINVTPVDSEYVAVHLVASKIVLIGDGSS
jgi:hypothetical protein